MPDQWTWEHPALDTIHDLIIAHLIAHGYNPDRMTGHIDQADDDNPAEVHVSFDMTPHPDPGTAFEREFDDVVAHHQAEA